MTALAPRPFRVSRRVPPRPDSAPKTDAEHNSKPDPLEPDPLEPGTDDKLPARGASSGAERDSFLDTVKAVAVLRVLAWHTWAWWPLSWFAAMPVMFCTSGMLLARSCQRHGYRATVRARLRRLLVPFWAYAVVAVALMVHGGWRPTPAELLAWVLPVRDPTGPLRFAPLWIPLWYLRAYLWFVITAPAWQRLSRSRAGLGAAAGVALATTVVPAPMALRDFAVFGVFVTLGMRWASRGLPSPVAARRALLMGAAVLAVVLAAGSRTQVVNTSYRLHALVGALTLAALLSVAPSLRQVGGRVRRGIDGIARWSLSIYLWQGLGLLVAARLVAHGTVLGALSAGVIVTAVTAAAVTVARPFERLAARRQDPSRFPSLRRAHWQETQRWSPGDTARAAVTVTVVVAAVVVATPGLGRAGGGSSAVIAGLPPSGQAVVARAALVEQALRHRSPKRSLGLAHSPEPGVPSVPVDHQGALDAAYAAWWEREQTTRAELGTQHLTGTVIAPDGREYSLGERSSSPGPLWSMTKAVTGAWLAQLAESGVVRLDDPLSRWVPEAPRGDRITLEMLARHMSGIASEADTQPPQGVVSADAELGRFLASPWFVAAPGSEFHYSRMGYFLLAWALERASGQSWSEHVQALALAAGATVSFDDATPGVSAPDDPGYHGHLWAAGGLVASTTDTARLFRYLMASALSPLARAQMASFSADRSAWYYGMGLVPNCGECRIDGARLVASRYGLDSLAGLWSFDERTGAIVVLYPDAWFNAVGPHSAFYALANELLDAVAPPPG